MSIDDKKMDWHLFWTAGAVVITLGTLIMGCFNSLSNDIRRIDNRLTKIEAVLIMKGIMPRELTIQ